MIDIQRALSCAVFGQALCCMKQGAACVRPRKVYYLFPVSI